MDVGIWVLAAVGVCGRGVGVPSPRRTRLVRPVPLGRNDDGYDLRPCSHRIPRLGRHLHQRVARPDPRLHRQSQLAALHVLERLEVRERRVQHVLNTCKYTEIHISHSPRTTDSTAQRCVPCRATESAVPRPGMPSPATPHSPAARPWLQQVSWGTGGGEGRLGPCWVCLARAHYYKARLIIEDRDQILSRIRSSPLPAPRGHSHFPILLPVSLVP